MVGVAFERFVGLRAKCVQRIVECMPVPHFASAFGDTSRRLGCAGPLRVGEKSLMDDILSKIRLPEDLKRLTAKQLGQLAGEARWISAGTNWPQVSLPTSM